MGSKGFGEKMRRQNIGLMLIYTFSMLKASLSMIFKADAEHFMWP